MPGMQDDDGGMTTLAQAPSVPIGSETRAACTAIRDSAPPLACDGIAGVDDGACAAQGALPRAGLLRSLVATIRLWRRRAQESQDLLDMSDAGLRDIGISRSEAWRAARKPFWHG